MKTTHENRPEQSLVSPRSWPQVKGDPEGVPTHVQYAAPAPFDQGEAFVKEEDGESTSPNASTSMGVPVQVYLHTGNNNKNQGKKTGGATRHPPTHRHNLPNTQGHVLEFDELSI